jgi:hypothetical protein
MMSKSVDPDLANLSPTRKRGSHRNPCWSFGLTAFLLALIAFGQPAASAGKPIALEQTIRRGHRPQVGSR